MHVFDPRRCSLLRALIVVVVSVLLVLFPPLLATARAQVLAPSDMSYDDLMVHAEHQRAAGKYAQSADLYGQAYRARPEAERADPIAEITVRSAMADYDLASPEGSDLALLEAEAQLLEEFLAARKQAQAAAVARKAKKVPQVPPDLVDELERLKGRIAELREAERKAAEEAAKAEQEQEPEPVPKAESKPVVQAPPEPDRSTRRTDGAIVGVGVVSFVGGVGLVAVGAANFVATKTAADDALAALAAEPRFTDEQRRMYREGLEEWEKDGRNVSTALVVSGAVLAAAGIGLTSWGVVRMRKHRSLSGSRAALAPALARQHIGVQITIGF